MKTTSLFSRLALGALLGSLLTACPTVPDPDPLEPAPSVKSFSASQSEVAPGGTVKLTWNVENATSVKIDELKLGSISGVSGNSGEVEVAITDDSLFVLTARNARGASDTAVVAVRVGSSAGALLLTALPNEISAGQTVTLAWSAPGAASVTLVATPGGPLDPQGQTGSGSITVSPTTSTSYELTAGGRSATTSVTVRPTLLSFTASTLAADAGATITLSWTTSNATRVQLTAPGRGTLLDEQDPAKVAAGSFDDTLPAVVDPGQLFPYQLVVTGPGATLTDSVVVAINGNPSVLTFTAPKYVAQGADGGLTLTWSTAQADAVSIAADGVEFYRAPTNRVAAGSLELAAPATSTTYQLTARHSRGAVATRSAAVEVLGPPTVSLTATPTTIAAGDPVAVSWAGTNVRNVRISSALDGTLFSAADTADTGSVPTPLSFAGSTVLRIDVDNGAGQTAFATVNITVTNGLQFTVPTGSTRAGDRVSLAWTPATTAITGLAHDDVVVRANSTGFDDIAVTGTPVVFASGDDGAAMVEPQGFSAPFFDRAVGDKVWIDADGYLSFTPIGNYNYSSVQLPSSKIEPYSIALCWTDVSTVSAYWQVKSVTGGQVLIVQWNAKYQVKVFSSGQVDIEYLVPGTCTNRGVRGPHGDTGFTFTTTPAANLGLTLFGPKTSPALVPVQHELTLAGTIDLGGRAAAVRADVGAVVRANELTLSEAMVSPAAAVGPDGQWFELFNARSTPLDLTGWTLSLPDGGSGVLSGSIAAHGVKVAGASLDPALNDDAGVEVGLPGFVAGLDAGTVSIARNGSLASFSWTNATPGTSIVNDFGPYRFSADTSSSVARPQTCVPTTGFGSQGQLGSPGVVSDCGFPYVWHEIHPGFYDISGTGTVGVTDDKDDANFTLPLTGAPFTWFGTPFTSATVSTNGFLSFDTNPVLAGASINQFPDDFPSTTDVNSGLVLFGGDLIGASANSDIYFQRVGANVDPFASAPHWIVQWSHWSHYLTTSDTFSDGADDLNFQVKLFDDGVIEYHFGSMVSTSSARSGTGIRTVTWLEDPTGSQALVINTHSYAPGISPNSAFRFAPR